MQAFLFVFLSYLTTVTAQYVANTRALIIKEIEHLYFDANPAGILSAVTPCSNYYDPSTGASDNSLGRNTAAEWIRTAFRRSPCSHQPLRHWKFHHNSPDLLFFPYSDCWLERKNLRYLLCFFRNLLCGLVPMKRSKTLQMIL